MDEPTARSFLGEHYRCKQSTNVGADKDSERRQREAVTAYTKAVGVEVITGPGAHHRAVDHPIRRAAAWKTWPPIRAEPRAVAASYAALAGELGRDQWTDQSRPARAVPTPGQSRMCGQPTEPQKPGRGSRAVLSSLRWQIGTAASG